MKYCPRCKRTKDKSEFYKSPSRYDGVRGYCRVCETLKQRGNRKYFRDYRRNRYASDSEFRFKIRKSLSKYQKSNPKKNLARVKLFQAIKANKINKLPCILCGEKANGHHPDYNKPLEVIWLCPRHHRHIHTGRIDLLLLDIPQQRE
jgi:formylmethanofuran dehydrogenase subunit E